MLKVERRSPYQGLIPFDEADAPFFFGREKETQLITANLFASPLTLLYGPSGVGKTSVLRAGAVHQLRQRDDLLVVVFGAWQTDPLGGLKAMIADVATRVTGEGAIMPDSGSLAECLDTCGARLDRRVVIILDQFEEYFLYHPRDDTFAVQFRQAVTRADLPVSFLISIREDSLAKLDRFEGHVPNLFNNYLRIEHLRPKAARAAIEGPLEHYNRLMAADEQRVGIEPALVEAVLEQVKAGQVVLGTAGRGIAGVGAVTPPEALIETPYLQMVTTRLWDEEMRAGSRILRLETLNRLGGAEHIVRTHLDTMMDVLAPNEQDAAARVFHYLVTPGGTKIAHTASDLAQYAGLPQEQLTPVLDRLSGRDVRILRPVAPPADKPALPRYEIFHDILATAVLDWRARYVRAQEQAEAEKRLAQERAEAEKAQRRAKRYALGLLGSSVLLLMTIVLTIFAAYRLAALEREVTELEQRKADLARETEMLENRVKEFRAVTKEWMVTLGLPKGKEPSLDLAQAALEADRERNKLRTMTATEFPNITIDYYPKNVDRRIVNDALKELGFEIREGKPTLPNVPTNAIWLGEDVPIEAVKLVAYTLIRAGIEIKIIRPFAPPPYRKRDRIEVGSDIQFVDRPPLTVEQIRSATRFTR